MDEYKITLMDGRELPCVLKPTQPKEIDKENLKLDDSGQYLSIKKRVEKKDPSFEKEVARQYQHTLFTENAWLLLEHAEEIMNDSRMFLAPVNVKNGLAYSGTSGFQNPTIGIYLEWWLNYPKAAIDANGNLIWYISGSPLSGSNCCSASTPDGEQVNIRQRTRFSDIWSSFIDVNTRYSEAKQLCEAYSLEDVVCKFRGEDYRYRITELKFEMRELVMSWETKRLQKKYDALTAKFNHMVNVNRKEFLRVNSEKIVAFYKEYVKRAEALKPIHEEYIERRHDLKIQYHAGTIEGDYRVLKREAGKEYNDKKRELSIFCNTFMRETFPKNINGISIADIIREGKRLCR